MNSISYQEYINIFAEKINNIFKYKESEESYGVVQNYIYVSEYRIDKLKSLLRIHGKKRSKEELLDIWIASVNNFPTATIYTSSLLKLIYEKVNLSDLDSYIQILRHQKIYAKDLTSSDIFKLLKMYKEIPNLSVREFMDEYKKMYELYGGIITESRLHVFKQRLTQMSNYKINPSWFIWANFSGEYINYIEWLPRETLEDTITVQNSGKLQPDYTTYIE